MLISLALSLLPTTLYACTQLPAGSTMWVRLTQSVNSNDAKPGMLVHGFLLESPECDGRAALPIHIPVDGRVVSGHRVGLGFVHETASLQIEFNRILPEQSPALEISGQVINVNNAREAVKNGVMLGTRSSETPQGEISSRLKYLPSLHLYPDPFLLGFKLLFPVFPEPEIYLPPGTDLHVVLKKDVALPEELLPPPSVPRISNDDLLSVADSLDHLPARTFDRKGHEADLINMAFVGSREEVVTAFLVAGWKQSDPVSRHSVMHQFHAFLEKTSYKTAPMSRQVFDGRLPDLTFEKTFNSYGRRDHLRIWQVQRANGSLTLWVGAAVRETGATLSVMHLGFMHHVSADLDEEQHAIERDLLGVDTIESVGSIERPDEPKAMLNATGEVLRTGGDVRLVRLRHDLDPNLVSVAQDAPFKPGSKFSRYVRKEILTVRSDLLRANCFYAVYRVGAAGTRALRAKWAKDSEIKSMGLHAPASSQSQTAVKKQPDDKPQPHVNPEFFGAGFW